MKDIQKKLKLASIISLGTIGVGGMLLLPRISLADTGSDCTISPQSCQIEQQLQTLLHQAQQQEDTILNSGNMPQIHSDTSFNGFMGMDSSNQSLSVNTSNINGQMWTTISGYSSGYIPKEDVYIYLDGKNLQHIKSELDGTIHYSLNIPGDLSASSIKAYGASSRKTTSWQLP